MKYDDKSCFELINKAKEKGYPKQCVELAIMLCCSQDANKICGSTSNALKKAIEVIDKSDSDSDFIVKLERKIIKSNL